LAAPPIFVELDASENFGIAKVQIFALSQNMREIPDLTLRKVSQPFYRFALLALV
jgi:hypothetical protein